MPKSGENDSRRKRKRVMDDTDSEDDDSGKDLDEVALRSSQSNFKNVAKAAHLPSLLFLYCRNFYHLLSVQGRRKIQCLRYSHLRLSQIQTVTWSRLKEVMMRWV